MVRKMQYNLIKNYGSRKYVKWAWKRGFDMAIQNKIKGFTFIEVLMVFALISILSLLLMPSVHTMKEKGRQATCIGNQRQLAVAAILYANESLSKLPLNLVSLDNPNYFPEYMKEEPVDFADNVYAQYTMADFYNNNMYLTQCPEVGGDYHRSESVLFLRYECLCKRYAIRFNRERKHYDYNDR